jgi:hypothetical protein
MRIRPWFLATLSLGFVAALLWIRGDSPLSPGNQSLADAAEDATIPNTKRRVTSAGRKVLRKAKEKAGKPAVVEGIADQVEEVVKKTADKVNKTRRSRGKTTVV